ncbi:MAG TPA: CvpA family protein [Candidatus Binataceae bacterium]|nr:CvpA family protein [Candidatus Binataceae bacterium]
MNAFDYVVLALMAAGALYGLRQGMLRMVTSVVSVAAGISIASIYYARAGAIAESQFGSAPTAAAVIGWVAIFALIFATVEIIGTTAIGLLHVVHLSWADRLAGSVLGAGLIGVIAGLAVMLLAAMLPADSALLKESRLAPMLIAYNEMLVRYIPQEAKDAYESNRANLMRYWIIEASRTIAPAAASPLASPSPAAK